MSVSALRMEESADSGESLLDPTSTHWWTFFGVELPLCLEQATASYSGLI
jgi:hypothetical protein